MNKIVASVGVVALFASVASATNYFVVPSGTPGVPENPDYLSWETAGTNIHEAVYLSNTLPAADNNRRRQPHVLYVKTGTYGITNQPPRVDGQFEIRSSKGPDAQEELDREGTILCGGYPATTNRIFSVAAGSVSRSCQIRGFTITNGWVGTLTKSGRSACWGGGVRFTAASHAKTGVYDCNIVGNTAFCGSGGGIATACLGGIVSNCLIACNLATNVWESGWNNGDFGGGGVMFNEAGGAGTSRSTRTSGCRLIDCVVSNNLATGNSAYGGGVGSGRAGHWIEHCTLIGNRVVGSKPGNAASGGTIFCDRFARIYDCVLTNNTCGTSASSAGIGCGNCAIVSNCTVIASGGISVGGDVQNSITQPSEIVGCYMDGCGTTQGACSGGANASVRNCFMTGYAGDGGAIASPANSCLFENCTIVRNYRGARVGASACVPFVNCVFDNRYTSGSQDISVPGTHSNVGATLTNCWFYAKNRIETFMPNTNCVFTSNPRFVDMENGDYHLTRKSPLRDAGLDRDWMTNAVDLDGNPRVFGKAVDIGCYENQELKQGLILLLR